MYRYIPFIFILTLIVQCQNTDKSKKKQTAQNEVLNNQDGETLAHIYCVGCHVFPEPDLLPKNVWTRKVLPNMATRMGMKIGNPYDKLDSDEMIAVINAHIIPDSPMLSREDMFKIVTYYSKKAPEKPLPQARNVELQPNLALFTVKNMSEKPISTQNIMLKPLVEERKLLLSFEDKGTWLYDVKNKKYEPVMQAACSDAMLKGGKLYLLEMLKTMAYNLPKGCLWSLDWQNGKPTGQPEKIIDGLKRPVSMDVADVNLDGKLDFIICEFGDYLGQLTLYLSTPQGYTPTILKPFPGACKAYFKDMNNDGKTDIVALLSQAHEEICLFLNKGQGIDFEEKSVVTFPPSYGSNSMEIADVNKDGLLDIITTNGDNADISYSLKPYHGVRIFQNEGSSNFKQVSFYPIYGASKVITSDFDKDGNLDLAVIAHFPDFTNKNPENFVFFKGDKSYYSFKPFQFPKPINGRLLTMDKMDMDGDGDEDLLIGNFIDLLTDAGDWYKNWTKQPYDWWVLENKIR
jgi:FG-GAP-like repeat